MPTGCPQVFHARLVDFRIYEQPYSPCRFFKKIRPLCKVVRLVVSLLRNSLYFASKICFSWPVSGHRTFVRWQPTQKQPTRLVRCSHRAELSRFPKQCRRSSIECFARSSFPWKQSKRCFRLLSTGWDQNCRIAVLAWLFFQKNRNFD